LNIPFTKALKLQADMNSFEVDLIYYNQSLVGKLFFFLQTQDLTLQINICKDLNNHIKKLPNQKFQYLNFFIKSWLFYRRGTNLALIEFTNVDWGGDIDFRNLIRRYFFIIGGTPITWNNKKKLYGLVIYII